MTVSVMRITVVWMLLLMAGITSLAAPDDELLRGNGYFDGWQLRMDNVVMSGDVRLLLTQIKARLVDRIQM